MCKLDQMNHPEPGRLELEVVDPLLWTSSHRAPPSEEGERIRRRLETGTTRKEIAGTWRLVTTSDCGTKKPFSGDIKLACDKTGAYWITCEKTGTADSGRIDLEGVWGRRISDAGLVLDTFRLHLTATSMTLTYPNGVKLRFSRQTAIG